MARKYNVPINLLSLASDPASATEGDVYYNTTDDRIRVYKNSTWVNLAYSDDVGITSTDYITFDTTPESTIPTTDGTLSWDSGESGLNLTANSNVDLKLGQQNIVLVKNANGSSIPKGSVVYINGAAGQRPTIALSDADTEATSSKTLGITSETIASGAEGFVTTFGVQRGVNTNGLTEGATLWLSSTAGSYSTTPPAEPAHLVFVGYVVKAHASAGEIFVNPQNGYELTELHGVTIDGTPADNEVLAYDTTSGLWINQTAAEAGLAVSSHMHSLDDLSDVSTSGVLSGDVLQYNGTSWVPAAVSGGGGSGTVTSVNMSVPTGLSISGNPITTSGTLALTFTTGYSIPTTSVQSNWNTAYGWGDHSLAGYLTSSAAASTYQPLDSDLTAIAALTASSGFLKTDGAGTWSVDTNTYSLSTHNHSGTYEPVITSGTTSQYWRGDKSWQTLNAASVGATTVGSNLFTLTNPSAITFIRINADNSVSALDAATFRTEIGAGTGSGDAVLASANTFTGANTFRNGTGQTFRTSSTGDGIIVAGRNGGTSSFAVTLGTATLTSNRAINFPNAAGTIALLSDIPSLTGYAVTSGTLAQFAATTSAQLAGVLSDETGFSTGALAVFNISPTISTSLITASTSFDLLNTTATTINFAGAATTLSIGAASGTTTVKNSLSVGGNIGTSVGAAATPTLWSEVTTGSITIGGGVTSGTINIGGNATSGNIYIGGNGVNTPTIWIGNTGAASTIYLGGSTSTINAYGKLVLNQGTGSKAPMVLNAGTNLNTQAVGSVEYDGTGLYFSQNSLSGRGIVLAPQIAKIATQRTKATNNTSLEPIFANSGFISLTANTMYYFRGIYNLTKNASATASQIQIGFGFGANAPQSINYSVISHSATLGVMSVTSGYNGYVTATTAQTVGPSTTGAATQVIYVEGFIVTHATQNSTFIPQFTQTVAGSTSAPTANVGTFIMVMPLSSDTALSAIGLWQ